MTDHFPAALTHVLRHEGGYVDHPNDPGGATKYGMSLRTLRAQGDADLDGVLDWDLDLDGDVDSDDIRGLTKQDAARYYRERWWDRYRVGLIHQQAPALKLFDMMVNMGARRAVRLAQAAVRRCGQMIAVDGVLGPVTAEALDHAPSGCLREAIIIEQRAFYQDLIRRRPSLAAFERGWMNRAQFWPEEG